jgi:orotate phosphoribosyltransferase
MDRKRLLKLIREKGYEKKKVVLSSGRESDFYVDCRQVTLNSEGAYLVGSAIYSLLNSKGDKVDAVGGLTLGADPIVTSVAVISHIRGNPIQSFIIRKEAKKHGLGAWIEGTKNLTEGMNVAILEDVVTTGGSTLKAIDGAKSIGMDVRRVICLVDRNEGGADAIRDAGYNLEAIFLREEIEGDK